MGGILRSFFRGLGSLFFWGRGQNGDVNDVVSVWSLYYMEASQPSALITQRAVLPYFTCTSLKDTTSSRYRVRENAIQGRVVHALSDQRLQA